MLHVGFPNFSVKWKIISTIIFHSREFFLFYFSRRNTFFHPKKKHFLCFSICRKIKSVCLKFFFLVRFRQKGERIILWICRKSRLACPTEKKTFLFSYFFFHSHWRTEHNLIKVRDFSSVLFCNTHSFSSAFHRKNACTSRSAVINAVPCVCGRFILTIGH